MNEKRVNWTKEEQALIAVLDRYVADCSSLNSLKNGSFYRYIPQILAISGGDIAKTSQYCQDIVKTGSFNPFPKQTQNSFAPSATSSRLTLPGTPAVRQRVGQELRMHHTKKFSLFWTGLFVVCAASTVFFLAKRSPNSTSVSTYQNLALFCPRETIETAQSALIRKEAAAIADAIATIEQIEIEQAGNIDPECQQILWRSQFIYAIEFLASSGRQKQATSYLCKIAPEFFQDKEVLPWLARWSNTNADFANWLQDYKATNSCASATYLE